MHPNTVHLTSFVVYFLQRKEDTEDGTDTCGTYQRLTARTLAELTKGSRITDYISVGVLSKTFPVEKVAEVLKRTGKVSQRQRDLPAHVVVYYVMALGLFMGVSYREVLRCLMEGIAWLKTPGAKVKITGKSGISQARTRLGYAPVKELHDEVVKPIARRDTKGAWYRQWHLVTLDGSTMETADNKENEIAFGRPGAHLEARAVTPSYVLCLWWKTGPTSCSGLR
ncbi:MAG: transposase family protein [Dehalococcoidia bacterium]|nr:transposase family protein [Dehalococcoidia bacterium]